MIMTPQYLADENGIRKSVVISLPQWEKLMEALEELEDIRAYEEAKTTVSEAVPFERALSDIFPEGRE